MPFHHHYSFLVYLIAGLCEGHYRNALVQAAQLAIPFALHTALWHSALLQRRGQYAVSILGKRERERVSTSYLSKNIFIGCSQVSDRYTAAIECNLSAEQTVP